VIDKKDYHLLMHAMIDMMAQSEEGEEFADRVNNMIMASYEINCPEHGAVEVIDITEELVLFMGHHWHPFQDVGIESVQFVRYLIMDKCVLETGRMYGKGKGAVAISIIQSLPKRTLKAFAHGMHESMRTHGLKMLDSMDGDDDDDGTFADNMGLAQLIRKYTEDEVDEAVAEFSKQLDSVFAPVDLVGPPDWSPPGGDAYDQPAPPV
jgi:hypothetical protein